MASHHHHDGGCNRLHHNNHRESIHHIPPPYYATSSPCFCADSSPFCTQSSPPNRDHLLRLIASYLQNQQQAQCSCETPSPTLNVVKRQSFVNQQQQHQQKKKKNVQREYDSLLRKIDDLDVSLSRFSARRGADSTLKDSAARVIQTHFRSYLVRRSVSLRQLKELALIKSSFLSLKSSVSGKTHFPFEAVSREATDLLLQLDSIQGRVDSMIRDGKRALCRDLVRFLHYIDDCAVKSRNLVSKSVKDVSFRAKRHVGEDGSTEKSKKQIRRVYVRSSGDEEDIAELEEFHFMSEDGQEIPIVSVEKSRKLGASKSRVEDNKVKTPVTKTVKISKSGNIYELTSSAEDDDSFDGGEEILMMSRGDGVDSSSRSRSGSGVVVKGSGGKTRVVKNVSFDESGNVYKVYGDTPEASVSEGDESSTSGSNNENGDGFNEVEDIKYVPKENEEDEEEEEDPHSEDEEESSSQSSKEEAQVTGNVSHTGRDEHKREVQLRKVTSMFSPPLPLKMELRADS